MRKVQRLPLSLIGVALVVLLSCGGSLSQDVHLVFHGASQIFLSTPTDSETKPLQLQGYSGFRSIETLTAAAGALYILEEARIYRLAPGSSRLEEIFRMPARRIAVDRDGNHIAALVRSPETTDEETFDILILNLASREVESTSRRVADYSTILSWDPSGTKLVFDHQNRIMALNLRDKSISYVCAGAAPSWSPSGESLALRDRRSVLVRDMKTGMSREIYRRRIWQPLPAGPLFWSLDGRFIALNAPGGITGDELDCVVMDVPSASKVFEHKSTFWCGPFIDAIGRRTG